MKQKWHKIMHYKDFIALTVSQQFSILQDPRTLKQYASNLISLRTMLKYSIFPFISIATNNTFSQLKRL